MFVSMFELWLYASRHRSHERTRPIAVETQASVDNAWNIRLYDKEGTLLSFLLSNEIRS